MALTSLMTLAGSQAIPHIINNMVLPALRRLADTVRKDYQLRIEHLGTHFGDYLKRAYDQNTYLNTIVFHNQQKKLRDLYIPLTLYSEGTISDRSEVVVKIDDYPKHLISKYRRILITDAAGMGKSTLSKIMFLSAIDNEAGIPFFVELRRLSREHLILDEIRDQLGSLTNDFDDSLMRAFFQEGGFIFFLDGFDEISGDERKEVIEDLKRFIDKAPENYYFMTSRPEQALVGFGDFRAMNIRPLEKEEGYELLRKYDPEGEISQRLIEKLEAGDYQRIRDFMQNPLLVSLLFIGFEYKPDIPLKIYEFYEQVFEALFYRHDLSKNGYYVREKKSGLEKKDFEKVLRSIGFICLRRQCLEFNRSDFLEVIASAEKLSCISLKSAEDMLDDLLHAVPLFCQDGVKYKWVHKSMQEYFAADFINRDCSEKKDEILDRIVMNQDIEKYSNLIDIYSDLDNNSFQRKFVLPILNDYIAFVDSPLNFDNQEDVTRVRYRRQVLYHFERKSISVYVLSDEESKNIKESIDKRAVYFLTKNPLCRAFYSNKTEWLFLRSSCDGRQMFLFTLLTRKYPQITERKSRGKRNVQFIDRGKILVVSEELYIDNPRAYDELNTILAQGLYKFVSYENAKRLKSDLEQQIRENEDVFKGLLEG